MPHTNNKDNKRKYPNSKSKSNPNPSFSKKPSNNKPDKKKQKTALSYNDTRKIKEIAFDADSRLDYVKGASNRKKDRRAFGLAMQKMKDRKQRLLERKEDREESQKELERKEEMLELDGKELLPVVKRGRVEEDDANEVSNDKAGETQTMKFDGESTKTLYGGSVSVSISYGFSGLGGDDSDDDEAWLKERNAGKEKIDSEQRKNGNVQLLKEGILKNLPSKRKKTNNSKGYTGRGVHGAQKKIGRGIEDAKKVLGKFGGLGRKEKVKGGKKEKVVYKKGAGRKRPH
ncbi:hypothetical protein TrST_g2077 [Triparma strigata]|uniref:Uncharacterized protein n=1 Tax=Triparma strigata TaxID=1606541 RepID=A0A9W7ABT5_9STRA|nr:hypothetical protein TrST_g2077 [Triparma strigata]